MTEGPRRGNVMDVERQNPVQEPPQLQNNRPRNNAIQINIGHVNAGTGKVTKSDLLKVLELQCRFG